MLVTGYFTQKTPLGERGLLQISYKYEKVSYPMDSVMLFSLAMRRMFSMA